MWHGLSRLLTCKEFACQSRRHRRHGFHPWIGKIPQGRTWQPTPVFLPGESHGQRSLVGYNPWGHKSQTQLSDWAYMHTLCDLAPNSLSQELHEWARQTASPSSWSVWSMGWSAYGGGWDSANMAKVFTEDVLTSQWITCIAQQSRKTNQKLQQWKNPEQITLLPWQPRDRRMHGQGHLRAVGQYSDILTNCQGATHPTLISALVNPGPSSCFLNFSPTKVKPWTSPSS